MVKPIHKAKRKGNARKRKGAKGNTLKIKGQVGHKGVEHRLALYKARAMQLQVEGLGLSAIAETVAREFDLERIPNISTVFRWTQGVMDDLNERSEKLAASLRNQQLETIHGLMRRWLPIAMAEHLRIQRWKQTAEGPEPYIDEHAYDESLKALKECVRLMERESRLMNLDLTKVTLDTGDGPKSLQDLQLWINQTIIYGDQKQMKGSEVLSLEAGIENVSIV